MRIIEEIQLDFDDVLIQPKRSSINSRQDVDIYREFKWTTKHDEVRSFTCIPISAANMGTVGTPHMAIELAKNEYMSCLEKHLTVKEIFSVYDYLTAYAINKKEKDETSFRSRVFVSIGTRESFDILDEVNATYPLIGINIDVPNGYFPALIERVKECRERYPNSFIIAGTVVTGDIVQDLLRSGASAVRCGIGQGSMCITRLKTGVGRPTLSMIMDCADAAHQIDGYIMCDGGVKTPGDVCKAFCAGADFVMSGSLFAGCDESSGEIVDRDGKLYKMYYGMSSKLAQDKHFGGMSEYRTSEGREKLIPYTGPLIDVINDINGGLRSCCTYIGSRKIKHMPRQASFYKVYHQVNTMFANSENIL